MLRRWYKRLRETQESHYEASKPLAKLNTRLGLPVVIFSTIVGTSVFASLSKEVNIYWKITVAVISILAAILAGLQTFLKFSEKSEAHRAIASQAGSLRRQIEQLIASGDVENISEEKLNSLREQIDKLSANAPAISEKIWIKAKKRLEED